MSKVRLPRRQREKQRHKKEILAAALALFADKGFYNVSMQEIAEKSEFGVGTLYNFFDSKEVLFEELIVSSAERIKEEFSRILESEGSVKARLAAFIRHQPEFQEHFGQIIRLYVSEFGVKGSKLTKLRDTTQVHEYLCEKIAKMIETGIKEGYYRDVDPFIAAKSLLSVMETVTYETIGNLGREEVAGMFKKIEHLFLDGLLISE